MPTTLTVVRGNRMYVAELLINGRAAREIAKVIPRPTDEELYRAQAHAQKCGIVPSTLVWIYRNQIEVCQYNGQIFIKTILGSGRGQTAALDTLVGDRISRLRKDLGREVRGGNYGEKCKSLHLHHADIERIITMLDAEVIEQGSSVAFLYQGSPVEVEV